METTSMDTAITRYVDAVRDALADLPEDERADLVSDLREHLAEVAAEGDGDLVERVGAPEAYAAELRASVGLAGTPARRRRLAVALRGGRLERAARRAGEHHAARAVLGFLPELRPGWWVARAAVLVFGAAVMTSLTTPADLPVPRLLGSRLVTVVALAGAVWASVALGRRRAERDGPYRRLGRLVDVAAVGVGLLVLAQLDVPVRYEVVYEAEPTGPGYLQHADGEPIANVCPYGPDGTLLAGVLLFDGRGRPITNVAGDATGDAMLPDAPWLTNAYPRPPQEPSPESDGWLRRPCPRTITGAGATAPDGASTGAPGADASPDPAATTPPSGEPAPTDPNAPPPGDPAGAPPAADAPPQAAQAGGLRVIGTGG